MYGADERENSGEVGMAAFHFRPLLHPKDFIRFMLLKIKCGFIA